MAQLRPLGQPFGSPSQIINIPAPVGDPFPSNPGAIRGLLALMDKRKQQQALQQFALQQGINIPLGLPPGLTGSLIANVIQRQGQQFTLPAGAQRRDAEGRLIAEAPFAPQRPLAPPGFKVVDKLVDDPQSPTGFSVEQFDQSGKSIGRRAATRKEVLQGVPEGALQGPTQTKIEKDIIDLNTTLAELDAIETQINPDFFTFRGKGKAFFTALGEKFEIPVPQAAKEFLSNKTKFFADSKRVFLKFRKFITGVAGGITEFKEIQKAAIDPEGDSETEFRSKFDSMRDNALRTKNVLLAMRNSGIDPKNPSNRRRIFNGLSLSNIPIDVSPTITLDALQGQQGLNVTEEARFQQLLQKQGQQ